MTNSTYTVSARKYRPGTFASVVGQEHITGTLKNAVLTNHLAHAYLFCGPRGVGKTTCARILAKTINCENLGADGEACNECSSCKSFNDQRSFTIYELDAASNNSVQDIRDLVDQVRIPPQGSQYKVYIIDEVHMLSQSAFNAFLKTLEEPPSYAIFILATTEKHKVLPTILSRCQSFDFNRIQVNDIVSHLAHIAEQENINAEKEALQIIAQKADGALRDSLTLFDRVLSYSGEAITYDSVIQVFNILDYDYYFKVVDSAVEGSSQKLLLIFDEIISHGFDGQQFLTGLAEHVRNLLVCKEEDTLQLLQVPENLNEQYLEQSQKCDNYFLLSMLNVLSQFEASYRNSNNPRLHVELALLKIGNLSNVLNFAQMGEKKK